MVKIWWLYFISFFFCPDSVVRLLVSPINPIITPLNHSLCILLTSQIDKCGIQTESEVMLHIRNVGCFFLTSHMTNVCVSVCNENQPWRNWLLDLIMWNRGENLCHFARCKKHFWEPWEHFGLTLHIPITIMNHSHSYLCVHSVSRLWDSVFLPEEQLTDMNACKVAIVLWLNRISY